MDIAFYIADAFVDPAKPFSGNPAAVVLLKNDGDIPDEDKQEIAAQFNLSETVFVSPLPSAEPGGDQFLIRWLTPSNEVNLCGHATMAATHVLLREPNRFSSQLESNKPIKYRTKFGVSLECALSHQSLVLNFPSNEPVQVESRQYPWLNRLLALVIGASEAKLVDVQWSAATKKLLLHLESADGQPILPSLKPDFGGLLQTATDDMVRGVIVTQKAKVSQDGVHFWSRYFAPWNGINEDPVTGSAHTVLAPYWKAYLKGEADVLRAKQVSKRSGLVTIHAVTNGRVLLGGEAKTFCKGTFRL